MIPGEVGGMSLSKLPLPRACYGLRFRRFDGVEAYLQHVILKSGTFEWRVSQWVCALNLHGNFSVGCARVSSHASSV